MMIMGENRKQTKQMSGSLFLEHQVFFYITLRQEILNNSHV